MAAVAQIQYPAWERPYARGRAKKKSRIKSFKLLFFCWKHLAIRALSSRNIMQAKYVILSSLVSIYFLQYKKTAEINCKCINLAQHI